MIDKVTTIEEAMRCVHSGDTVLIAGFGSSGQPHSLLKYLAAMPVDHLTAVSEDMSYSTNREEKRLFPELITEGKITHLMVSFLGRHVHVQEKIADGSLTYELIPQGTLAERLRAGGAGIGGLYLKTGVGTIVEEGKEKRIIDGEEYILEKPIKGDVALLKCFKADRMGNAVFRYAALNFNLVMAMAGKTVILEADEIVEPGELEPDQIHVPGVLVDYVVQNTYGPDFGLPEEV